MNGKHSGIILLGLGPGEAKHLTREAWEMLNSIEKIYLRTKKHPAVDELPKGLEIISFDAFYEQEDDFSAVYERITAEILKLGAEEKVVYAVPGHPMTAESTGPQTFRRAKDLGIPVQVVDGLSFIEPIMGALGLDLFPQTTFIDALELTNRYHPLFPQDKPALICQVYSQEVAADLKLNLLAAYPDEHPVMLVHAAGTTAEEIEEIPLYEIDRSDHIGLLTSLYLPPLSLQASFEGFQNLIAHLRSPEGCAWDREQDHQTLRRNLLEETYEAIDAIDADNAAEMQEELGDLLLQIVLHAQIGVEYGEFSMADVVDGIYKKIYRRHPHVFGNAVLNESGKVIKKWEEIKSEERRQNGEPEKGVLDGVSHAMPGLARAEAYTRRAARVGFDWPDVSGVLEKIAEEITEFTDAKTQDEKADEMGDLLFAMVNLARWVGVDPEAALRSTNEKFLYRFKEIERHAREQGRALQEMSLEEMDQYWNEAKGK